MHPNSFWGGWHALTLALRAQVASYRQRLWEPLLIVVAIFIASAGLTAVTLINQGASQQLNSFRLGPWTVSEQVAARRINEPVTQADYATLRQQGFDFLIAFTWQPSSGQLAVDTLAALSLPTNGALTQADPADTSYNGTTRLANLPGVQDLNAFYQGEITLQSHPLRGLAIVGRLSAIHRQQLQNALPEHLHVVPVRAQPTGSNLSDSFHLNLWAMGTLMLVVSGFIIFNALNLMLAARMPLLIKLRQLGIHQSTLLWVLMLEMMLLAMVGAILGVVVGTAVITTFTPSLNNLYQLLFDSSFNSPPLSIGAMILRSSLLSLAAVGAIAVVALRRLKGGMSWRKVLATTRHVDNQPRYWCVLAIAVVAMVVGASYLTSQLAALLFIGLVLLVGCVSVMMAMPVILRGLAHWVSAKRPVLHWSVHNAIGLSRRTKLAASAFFIALAANIGMNVMVDSFRIATESWLEQRLFAPYYVYTNHDGDLSTRADAPAQLLARYGKNVRLAGQHTELRSFPQLPEFKRYLMLDQQHSDAWPLFYGREGVFINQQLAYRQAIEVGDSIELSLNETPDSMTVVGIYPDYGNPHAQILLPDAALAEERDNITAYAAMMIESQTDALQVWLDAVAPDARLLARETLIKQSMSVFVRTFATTDLLNMVTMLVAALSFFVSISLLVLDITPQLHLLRTVGISPHIIKLSLFGQYCFVAVSCAIVAVPFALLLAWLLVAKVNRYAFHWTYPLTLDPAMVIQSLLVGLGILCVLLLLPLGRLKAKFTSQQETV